MRTWRATRTVLGGSIAILLALGLAGAPAHAAPDSMGTDFWLVFPMNFGTPTLSLFITGDTATTGTVEIPGLGFSAPFTVTPGTVTTVAIPAGAQLTLADGTESKGIHVTALAEVTVYGLNRITFTTDAYLGLPTDILGTEYLVLSYDSPPFLGSLFAVVATVDDTTVTITPSTTVGARLAGVPYNVVLDQGQAYELMTAAAGDLSGTLITADQPVAVFGGHRCANVPPAFQFCDHLVEQLPPISTWGRSFLTMPLATRQNGDTFRFLAAVDGTNVQVNGTTVATLDRGQVHERIITGPAEITADQPILVAQYSNGNTFDPPAVVGDPFMMLVPPFEQFLASYTVTTPASGFTGNFINVVTPTGAVGSILLDGSPIPAGSFVPIGTSGFSGTQVAVGLGSHTLGGPLPFGVFVYGFAADDSYGYPGGLSLAPVVSVTDLSLSPASAENPVGTEHCVTATVTDGSEAPVEGVRVDFAVTGANPTAGFATTDATGQARFCYGGESAGLDSIIASVGEISDTASKTWTGGGGGDAPVLSNLRLVRRTYQSPGMAALVDYLDPNADLTRIAGRTTGQNVPVGCAVNPSPSQTRRFSQAAPTPDAGTAEAKLWEVGTDTLAVALSLGCSAVRLDVSVTIWGRDQTGLRSKRLRASDSITVPVR